MKILSPIPEEFIPQVWDWCKQFEREVLDDRSPQSLEQLIEKHSADIELGGKTYLIVGELPLGAAWFENVGDGVAMGHLVFGRHEVLPSEKLNAIRDCIQFVFKSGFRKIIWMFYADNRPFHIFLRRLGAVQEGVFRDHVRRNGQLIAARFMASFPEGN